MVKSQLPRWLWWRWLRGRPWWWRSRGYWQWWVVWWTWKCNEITHGEILTKLPVWIMFDGYQMWKPPTIKTFMISRLNERLIVSWWGSSAYIVELHHCHRSETDATMFALWVTWEQNAPTDHRSGRCHVGALSDGITQFAEHIFGIVWFGKSPSNW